MVECGAGRRAVLQTPRGGVVVKRIEAGPGARLDSSGVAFGAADYQAPPAGQEPVPSVVTAPPVPSAVPQSWVIWPVVASRMIEK
jgi:hypothetical protein